MGCTSSAQNMTPSLANSDIGHMAEIMDDNQIRKVTEIAPEAVGEPNGNKVLPLCDNLDEPMHLDSHSKPLVDMMNPDLGKDCHANGYMKESDNENKDTNYLVTDVANAEERLSHLEEVVEKVVELYENGELEIPTESEQTTSKVIQTKLNQGQKDNVVEENQEDNTETNDLNNDGDELASPSQSQSSRATRWEALADIAAELPPSLAIDPLTGTIYTLK